MPIRFTCSCGKEMEVLDELAGQRYKCRACGAAQAVPAPGAHPAPRPSAPHPPVGASAEPPRRCFMCETPLGADAPFCRRCGWDGKMAKRHCLSCGGVVGNFVVGPVIVAFYAISWIGPFAVSFLYGFLASLAFAFGLVTVGGLFLGMIARFRCRDCKKPFAASLMSDGERQELRGSRNLLFTAAVVCGVLAVVFYGFFAAARPAPTSEEVRAWAQKGEAATADLVLALDYDSVRDEALAALRKIGRPAVPSLIKALKSRDDRVRYDVGDTLAGLAGEAPEAVPALVKAWQQEGWKYRFGDALRKVGEPAVPGVIEGLKGGDEVTRIDAAEILEALGSKARAAVPTLLEAAKDPSERVRAAADQALRKIQR